MNHAANAKKPRPADSDTEANERLARRMRALSHPARIAILMALGNRDKCHCGEIVRGLPLAQSTVSEHLRVLKEAGLVRGEIAGPRSCYCIDREAVTELSHELNRLLAAFGVEKSARPQSAER